MAAECPPRPEVTELHRRVNQVTDEVMSAGIGKPLLKLFFDILTHEMRMISHHGFHHMYRHFAQLVCESDQNITNAPV